MAVDMFLILDGIKGEAQDDKHKDSIDVLAWSWGEVNSGTTHVGGGGGAGKVSAQDLSVTKWVDKSSTALLGKCATGEHIKTGKLIVRKAGGKPVEYIVIDLKEILVTSVQTGGSGGEDRLTENISLNFKEIEFHYTIQDDQGNAGATSDFGYNYAENKTV